jgi:hypothetical protein
MDHWSGWVACFIGQEFCYYWYHRAAHRVRWFWCTHAVHHTPNQLNLSAAYRFGWTGKLTGSSLFFMLAPLLGMPPRIVLMLLSLNLLYQFWIHATWIPRLGPLEWILNTPSAHRVHHAANLEYLDGNYGGVLIVFDRLFGTYIAERADTPCRYGLVADDRLQPADGPGEIEFHQWRALWRDLRTARSFADLACGYLLKPPGWRPSWSVTLELNQNHHLVTQGVYRRIRHPMYASFFAMALGQALLLNNWIAGFAALVAVGVLYRVRTPNEERMMLESFGDEYRAYMRRTGGIVPRATLS